MTHANPNQWLRDAKPANSIVPIARFVTETVFATKTRGYGVVAAVAGVDEEGLTDQEVDAKIRAIEGGLRGCRKAHASISTCGSAAGSGFRAGPCTPIR